MKETVDSCEHAGAQCGLIGFFDVLGYKSIIENNSISEMISIVRKIQETADQHQKFLSEWAPSCGHVLFSDSILVYAPFSESRNEHNITGLVAEFCAGLLNDLFWAGLPIRGAWAFGEFYIDLQPGKVCLAGMPIVEAFEFCNCLDLAGCVVAPSAETILDRKEIIDSSSRRPLGFIKYPVPLKGRQKQEMFMLNHYAMDLYNKQHSEISRQTVMEKFAAHNKRISVEVLSKVNNTVVFLGASKGD